MKTLEQLEPGDTVAMSHGWYRSTLHIVDRVTATQIIVGKTRFNRKSGRQCGDVGRWNSSRLYVPTAEDIREIEWEKCASKIAFLERKDLAGVSLENLQKAIELLETKVAE